MKKLALCVIAFVFMCFLIPILFTNSFENRNIEKEENKIVENKNLITTEATYDYKKYKTIKLLHKENGKVENLPMEEYLYGVVCSEMPANFEEEALKAQAVVARTYTLYKIINGSGKHKNEKADICDSPSCCQAWLSKEERLAKWEESKREEYWSTIVNAVNNTQGKIITYNNQPINAFFHSNSGGTTETPINVWGGSNYPYLQAVQTSGEDAYSQYASKVTVTKKEFEDKIKKLHKDFKIDFTKKDCIEVKEYTDGNRVKEIKVGNLSLSGVEMRNIFSLRSANFKVIIENDEIKFEVVGYGHGVGLSQTGADSLAKQGKNYKEIIKHFYTGVEIKDV